MKWNTLKKIIASVKATQWVAFLCVGLLFLDLLIIPI